MAKFFYAVKVGNAPGIYNTWSECEEQVRGFKGAKFKKFKTYEEARDFIEDKYIQVVKENIVNQESNTKEVKKEVLEEIVLDDEVLAYVDGSFSLEYMIYSYGVVLISKGGIETFKAMDDDPTLVKMRNVSGELKGAMVAMELAIEKNYQKISLHYDYAGIEKWALGQWKTNKSGTQDYKKFYDSIKDKLDVKFIKVKAHSGVRYNELADRLAKEAIDEYIDNL